MAWLGSCMRAARLLRGGDTYLQLFWLQQSIRSASSPSFGGRIKNGRVINVVKPVQLIIATLAMAMMIYIEQANAPVLAYANSTKAVALNYLSSIIFSLFVLALEYNMLSKEEIKGELLTTRQILEQERLQYELKKDVVDVINIKCHDLRHQLASVGGIMHEAELTKIENAIGLYDISKKTGNRALDVVLTLQSIVCYNKGVDFTCLACSDCP